MRRVGLYELGITESIDCTLDVKKTDTIFASSENISIYWGWEVLENDVMGGSILSVGTFPDGITYFLRCLSWLRDRHRLRHAHRLNLWHCLHKWLRLASDGLRLLLLNRLRHWHWLWHSHWLNLRFLLHKWLRLAFALNVTRFFVCLLNLESISHLVIRNSPCTIDFPIAHLSSVVDCMLANILLNKMKVPIVLNAPLNIEFSNLVVAFALNVVSENVKVIKAHFLLFAVL